MSTTQDPLAGIREQQRQQSEQEWKQSLSQTAAMNPDNPDAGELAPFSESNEAWLAARVKESRDKSVEYARLQTEESRQQWEALTRANLLRDQQNSDAIKSRIETDQNNTRYRDEGHFKTLAEQAIALMPKLAQYANPVTGQLETHRMPIDLLREYSANQQELATVNARLGLKDGEAGPLAARLLGADQQTQVQPQVQQPQKPGTFPDGTFYKLTKNTDGTIQVNLPTGEVFTGDPITVTEQLAKSKAHTTAWARQKVAQAQQSQPQQQFQQPSPLPSPEPQENTFGEWAANEQARALGFSDKNEMLHWGNQITNDVAAMRETKEEWENQRLASSFMLRNPDFPGSDDAAQKISQIIEGNRWEYTLDSMTAAHAYAVRNNLYQPLTPEQQQASMGIAQPHTRPAPPPMLSGRSPDATQQHDNNPYTIPLSDLRKQAIAQELNR